MHIKNKYVQIIFLVSLITSLSSCQEKDIDFDYMLKETFGAESYKSYNLISSTESSLFLTLFGEKRESYIVGVTVDNFDEFLFTIRHDWKPQPPPGFKGKAVEWERIQIFDRYGLTSIAKVNEENESISVFYFK